MATMTKMIMIIRAHFYCLGGKGLIRGMCEKSMVTNSKKKKTKIKTSLDLEDFSVVSP